jgi:hypothetical protein
LNIQGIYEKDVSGWTRKFGVTARVKKTRILSAGPIILLQSREPVGGEAVA